MALIVDNVDNGAARPFFGWVSDQIGRENTMAIAFGLGGVAYWLLGRLGTRPGPSCCSPRLIFFTWGEIFSLFPSTCTDTFGPKYATVNPSLLYTAKGASAFLVPLANVHQGRDRQLAHGVRRHRDHELRVVALGAVRAQADAIENDGTGLNRASLLRKVKPGRKAGLFAEAMVLARFFSSAGCPDTRRARKCAGRTSAPGPLCPYKPVRAARPGGHRPVR